VKFSKHTLTSDKRLYGLEIAPDGKGAQMADAERGKPCEVFVNNGGVKVAPHLGACVGGPVVTAQHKFHFHTPFFFIIKNAQEKVNAKNGLFIIFDAVFDKIKPVFRFCL
jgi:hypothetical protein